LLLLSFAFYLEQTADFLNCSINLIKPVAALFEHRRKFDGAESRGVRSSENHVANDRREAKSGSVLNYRITVLKLGVRVIRCVIDLRWTQCERRCKEKPALRWAVQRGLVRV
jgi:hypothetical protein